MQRKCYPYIRFSTKKQEFGTSYARQSDIESFLERHSLVVDTTLEDLGKVRISHMAREHLLVTH